MGDLFCFLYKYYMKIQEAQQILHDNGFLMENLTEDIISDILWDNLNTDTNTSMQGIRKVCDFLEYDLGKPIERASVKRIAETIVKLYNLGYESERFHPNRQRKIELKDAMKAAALIKSKAKEAITETTMTENKHFDLWQYKLSVKKELNKWLKSKTWFKSFDYMRSYIKWEIMVDIVTETMKDYFEQGKSVDDCVEQIKGLAEEAIKIGG